MKRSELTTIIKEEIKKLNEVSFTKQHYIAIANILKSSKNKNEIGNKLTDLFADDNPKFNKDIFLKVAGIKK